MHRSKRLTTVLSLLTTLAVIRPACAGQARSEQNGDLQALGGTWLYVEDRTKGRARAKQGPPMSVKFGLRVGESAVVMLRGSGSRQREERIPLNNAIEVPDKGTTRRSRGSRQDGALEYVTEVIRNKDNKRLTWIKRVFRITPQGLLVRVVVGSPPAMDSLALYRHPKNIPLPAPAKARMSDLGWLAGAWLGKRGKRDIEERWSPPRGGAMLGLSRTISKGRMVAFEYLRVVERDGGLVYVAQPGGRSKTEFVLTALGERRAVFDNPRHDYPQRIVYELSALGQLSASIGFVNGGSPRRFEFQREGK